MVKKGDKSKKEDTEPEKVDGDATEQPPKSAFKFELIPEYRIEKALRHYIKQPLTRNYIGTVHYTIDFLANLFLQQTAKHSLHTFKMRNTWLAEANRKPKTRMDDGVLSDLYYEVGAQDQEKLDEIKGLVDELKDSIGFFKTAESVGRILYLGDALQI